MAIKCGLPDLVKVLIDDESGQIKQTGKWPLLIDSTEQACTFLKYRNVNYLCAIDPNDMQEEKLRIAVLGSLRFGRALVIDMMDKDMFTNISGLMNRINPKLMEWILNKEILQEEKYELLIKESDCPEYDPVNFSPDFIQNFIFILATTGWGKCSRNL